MAYTPPQTWFWLGMPSQVPVIIPTLTRAETGAFTDVGAVQTTVAGSETGTLGMTAAGLTLTAGADAATLGEVSSVVRFQAGAPGPTQRFQTWLFFAAPPPVQRSIIWQWRTTRRLDTAAATKIVAADAFTIGEIASVLARPVASDAFALGETPAVLSVAPSAAHPLLFYLSAGTPILARTQTFTVTESIASLGASLAGAESIGLNDRPVVIVAQPGAETTALDDSGFLATAMPSAFDAASFADSYILAPRVTPTQPIAFAETLGPLVASETMAEGIGLDDAFWSIVAVGATQPLGRDGGTLGENVSLLTAAGSVAEALTLDDPPFTFAESSTFEAFGFLDDPAVLVLNPARGDTLGLDDAGAPFALLALAETPIVDDPVVLGGLLTPDADLFSLDDSAFVLTPGAAPDEDIFAFDDSAASLAIAALAAEGISVGEATNNSVGASLPEAITFDDSAAFIATSGDVLIVAVEPIAFTAFPMAFIDNRVFPTHFMAFTRYMTYPDPTLTETGRTALGGPDPALARSLPT